VENKTRRINFILKQDHIVIREKEIQITSGQHVDYDEILSKISMKMKEFASKFGSPDLVLTNRSTRDSS